MTHSALNRSLPYSTLDERDLLEQLRQNDRADWRLLAAASCSAIVTLLVAAAISLAR